MSRGPRGGRRALWETKPEVRVSGYPDSGRVRAGGGGGGWRPARKEEEGSAPPGKGRSAGLGNPEEPAGGGMTLGAGSSERSVSLGTQRSPHPGAAAGLAGSGRCHSRSGSSSPRPKGGKWLLLRRRLLKGPKHRPGNPTAQAPPPPRTAHNNLNQLQPPLHYRHPPP